jgi:hypothetical protein
MHWITANPNRVIMARNDWKQAKTAKKKAETFTAYQFAWQWYLHCVSSKEALTRLSEVKKNM